EDGIRDLTVTGVQTCALPISANLLPVYGVWFLDWNAWEVFAVYTLETIIVGVMTIFKMGIASTVKKKDVWENNGTKTMVSGLFRSEERRVGKECSVWCAWYYI